MADRRKKPRNYVDNAKLYQCFIDWYADREAAEKEGKPEPQPPIYISECIMLIPTRLASKGNFSGYSFKDEMIGDAIENLIQYYRNFDPVRFSNPFAYFTQISYYAFLRRIMKEKKQAYVKHKILQNSEIMEIYSTQDHDAHGDYSVSIVEMMQGSLNPDLERLFEKSEPKAPRKKRKLGDNILDKFFEEDEVDEEMGADN